MRPKYFDQANVCLQPPKQMPDCGEIYAHRNNASQVVTLWTAPWWKRIQFLFQGKMWLVVYGGETQPPVHMEITSDPFSDQTPKFAGSMKEPSRSRKRQLRKLAKQQARRNRINGRQMKKQNAKKKK